MQTNDEAGTQILKIKKEEVVFVKLKSLATAGFVWVYSVEDSSIANIERRDNEFLDQRKRVGDSGLEIFAIKGLKKGETKIRFEQKRLHDTNAVKTKIYLIKVD